MTYSTKNIIDFYINLCKASFSNCYHGWQRDRKRNIHLTMHAFVNGKDNDVLENAVLICDEITGRWLEDLTNKKRLRLYNWPEDYEAELREQIKTSLPAD